MGIIINKDQFKEEFGDVISTAIKFDKGQMTKSLLKTIKSKKGVQKFVASMENLIADFADELAEKEMGKPENILQLGWDFDEAYNDKYVICYYITYSDFENVKWHFDTLDEAMAFMDEKDLWEDYYIYHIKDGHAYGWEI